uniref:Uncharacterized protein n=1 Tax=Oryza punctata TaxID=4537 RepID=A0A0E0L7T2_ORYPU
MVTWRKKRETAPGEEAPVTHLLAEHAAAGRASRSASCHRRQAAYAAAAAFALVVIPNEDPGALLPLQGKKYAILIAPQAPPANIKQQNSKHLGAAMAISISSSNIQQQQQ